MVPQHLAYVFALFTGIVSSGAVASLWAALRDEPPHFRLLINGDDFAAFKVPIVVLSVPIQLLKHGCWWMFENVAMGLVFWIIGMALSFFQGVFILTQIFGVT